jgi:DNA-nicking Smr family endonuclease
MARPKRPADPSATSKRPAAPSASKRPADPGAKQRPVSLSLRDQMKALAPEVVAAAEARAPSKPATAPRPVARPSGDGLSFKDLAGRGGVMPLPEASRAPLAPPQPVAPLPRVPKQAPRLWVERLDDVVRAKAHDVPGRWLDDMGAGRIPPRRELDLHRKGVMEAREMLDRELVEARRVATSCMLIVCGKGIHSGLEGPVLPDVVIERLSEALSAHVLAFCTAPRRWGGSGALLVMLRPPAKDGE